MEAITSSDTTSLQGTSPPYDLEQLYDESCWSMIEKKAFSPGGALKTKELTNLGKEIARKCRGLPLAAKFLGGLLYSRNRESDWISIRDDDIWNTTESEKKTLEVLKLCYNNLPSHLKQCFSYCSIFPKNWEISKETLVHLWMAEGFLKHSEAENKNSIEDIGRGYFESLVRSSFFYDFTKNELDETETCKMHDLVHDFARGVSGDNNLVFSKVSELTDVSEIRRLQLELDVDISAAFLQSLSNAKKLQTLIIPEGNNLDPSIFSRNKQLRILHVGPSPNYALSKVHSLKLPTHLRYLCLTSLDPSEFVYDQSISKLYNLETLILSQMDIGVQKLLENIHSLKNLRYLEISWTDMEELSDSVTSLSNLETLDLNNCELNVIPASICGLKNLRFLNLSCNPIEELTISLTTLSNLEILNLNTCKKLKALPEYVAGLTNLRIFDFKNCPLLKELPQDFGELTELRSLNLEGTGIKVLPESCSNLRNLEIMILSDCELPRDLKNWIKLRKFDHDSLCTNSLVLGTGKLGCLRELFYSVRGRLTYEPEFDDGIEELENLHFLEMLIIYNIQNVPDTSYAEKANLKGKQNLRHLELYWDGTIDDGPTRSCKNASRFGVFEALQPPTSLTSLFIYQFMGTDLPMWMCVRSGLPNLDTLILQDCRRIRQLPAVIGQLPLLRRLTLRGMPLKDLGIRGFPSLVFLDLSDLFQLEELCYPYPCLQRLVIHGCKRLSRVPCFHSLKELDLQKIHIKLVSSFGKSHTSLKKIFLHSIKELILFPVSILQNNCNLETLVIAECNQFQVFRYWFPRFHTSSIRTLEFIDCTALKYLPDLRGWTSLHRLTVFGCPQVQEVLTYDLKSLSFLRELYVDFIQRDEQRGDPSVEENLINLMTN